MKLPPERAAVRAGDRLEFCDGTRAKVLAIAGDCITLDLEGTRLNSEEKEQSLLAVQKWVARGLWKIRRARCR